MTKKTKLAKLAAFLTVLVMLLGSFPGRYNVTIAYSEEMGNVTEVSELSEEERKAAEEEAARKAEEEEAARRKAEEEEAARKKAEEEEAARKKAEEEEAARKAAEEEAARKKAEEEEAARKAAEEEAARKAAEEAAKQAEVSGQIEGEPAPEMDQPETPADDDFGDFEEFDDFDDFDESEDDEEDEDDEGTIILDDWDAGVVSNELLERFNSTSNYEQMEFNGTAEIELRNEGMLRYGDEIKLEAKVQDVNLSYRLIWEANDNDDRGWYTIASGERYSYTLTADNLDREYRVVLFSLD